MFLGSKIGQELKVPESDVSQSLLLDLNEQADLGIPEPVNRLHGISYQKQGIPFFRFPSLGEEFEQGNLLERSILKLIDQNVIQF